MRTVEELIDINESGWTLVNEWINSVKNKVEILKADHSIQNLVFNSSLVLI